MLKWRTSKENSQKKTVRLAGLCVCVFPSGDCVSVCSHRVEGICIIEISIRWNDSKRTDTHLHRSIRSIEIHIHPIQTSIQSIGLQIKMLQIGSVCVFVYV